MISMLKEKVTRRNNILSGLTAKPAHMVQPPTLTVVQLLDAAKPSVAVESLSDACRQVIPDINEIVMVLLKWASSVHRLGMHRKYLACRLILFWNSHDRVDVGNCVIVALDKLRGCDSICPDSLARVVAELVRAGQFNVAHYLRSLLSAGGLKNVSRTLITLDDCQIHADAILGRLCGFTDSRPPSNAKPPIWFVLTADNDASQSW